MFAVIDVETTGGHWLHDRITEIAVFVHDGLSVVSHYETLINPERLIPFHIQRMTGITNEMVAGAPRFFEVARRIVELTEGKIFVAHNSQFDYGFIRNEFKNLGYDFRRDTLCTCKMSRKLLPGLPSYSLGRLCQSLDIVLENRHRAGGDAAATVKLFEHILSLGKGSMLNGFVKPWNFYTRLPEQVSPEMISRLPESPGVYYFHDENGTILYIGKSRNIRKRVLQHFRVRKTARSLELLDALKDITFEETGNELIALLHENDEIKKHQPRFNRLRKNRVFRFGIFENVTSGGYGMLEARPSRNNEMPLASFEKKEDAQRSLLRKMKQFNLCARLCGMEPLAEGACFDFKIGQCNGACCGKEKPEVYNVRVQAAANTLRFEIPDFLLIGQGRTRDEHSVVKIEDGAYCGFGFFNPELTGDHPGIIADAVQARPDNSDARHLVMQAVKSKNYTALIPSHRERSNIKPDSLRKGQLG